MKLVINNVYEVLTEKKVMRVYISIVIFFINICVFFGYSVLLSHYSHRNSNLP